MRKFLRFVTKPWTRFYSRARGQNLVQTKEKAISNLFWFYFVSICISFALATVLSWDIQIPDEWNVPASSVKTLSTVAALMAAKFIFDFIKDFITTEVGSALDQLKADCDREAQLKENRKVEILTTRLQDSKQEIAQLAITEREKLDLKYCAYLPNSIDRPIQVQRFNNSKLKSKFFDDPDKFNLELEKRKINLRERGTVRCRIRDLPQNFLQWLVIQGMIQGLNLKRCEDERVRFDSVEGDLYPLRVDFYAYLSAWLVCSIDNDAEIVMDISPIGMTYKGSEFGPAIDTYRKVIKSIQEIISSQQYRQSSRYPKTTDPLQEEFCRDTIVEYLDKLTTKIEEYTQQQLSST